MDDSPALCEQTDWKLPWKGGCRCGETRFEVTRPPLLTAACHCSGCQRMSASAYSLTIAIPDAGFALTQGAPVIGGLHGETRHHFCPHCLSWMFTRPSAGDFVNLRPTMLDERSWFVPFVEYWTAEKLPWVETVAVHSFESEPDISEFPQLLEQFAARGVCFPG